MSLCVQESKQEVTKVVVLVANDGKADKYIQFLSLTHFHRYIYILLHKKTVSHVINSRALIGEKPCINKAIHVLLMHTATQLSI